MIYFITFIILLLVIIIVNAVQENRQKKKEHAKLLEERGIKVTESEKTILIRFNVLFAQITEWQTSHYKGSCSLSRDSWQRKVILHFKGTPVFVAHYKDGGIAQPPVFTYMLKSEENVATINSDCWNSFKEFYEEFKKYVQEEKIKKDKLNTENLESYKNSC